MAATTLLAIFLVILALQGAVEAKKDTQLFGLAKGTPFSDGDHYCVLGIRVYYTQTVHGIQMKLADDKCVGFYCCMTSNGNWSTLHGSTKGSMKEISLIYPEDNLVQIQGRYVKSVGISQLTFVSYNSLIRDKNGKVRPVIYGPYGGGGSSLKNQTSFTTRGGKVCITGIWGYASANELKGLGYYWRECRETA